MANTLTEIWRDQPAFVEAKSFRQTIQLAGDGRLRDGNGTSQELRDWLAAISLERLRGCVEECLAESFEDGSLALQDAANELGTRLGFQVSRGRYRGVKGEIGNDGLWRADDGFSLLVEVKTTGVGVIFVGENHSRGAAPVSIPLIGVTAIQGT